MANTKSKAQAPSRLNHERVEKGVDALLKWVKSKAKHQKPQLLEHDDLLYLVVTLKRIPDREMINPYKIRIPHPLFSLDGSQEVCLIINDRENGSADVAKNKVKEEGLAISKVLKYSKLKTDYKPFEAKRKLCGSFDLFFADKSVVPLLPKLLGKAFFKKKKHPIPVDLTRTQWRGQIESACSSAFLYLGKGSCCVIKVARVSQTRNEIVENVVAVIDGLASVIPKKWNNIRSLHLKSLESLALPIYQSIPEMPLKIEGVKTESQTDKPEKREVRDQDVEKKIFKKGQIRDVRYMDNMLGDFSDGFIGGEDGDEVNLLDSTGDKEKDVDSSDEEKETTGRLSSKKRIADAEKTTGAKRKKVLSSEGIKGSLDGQGVDDRVPKEGSHKKKSKSVGLQGEAVANGVEAAAKKAKSKKLKKSVSAV